MSLPHGGRRRVCTGTSLLTAPPAQCVMPPGYCHGRGRQARPASPLPACGSLSQSPAPPEPVVTLGESGGAAYCPAVGKLQLGRGGGAGNAISRPPAPTGRGQKWSARPSRRLRDSKLLPAAFSVPGSGRCVPCVRLAAEERRRHGRARIRPPRGWPPVPGTRAAGQGRRRSCSHQGFGDVSAQQPHLHPD